MVKTWKRRYFVLRTRLTGDKVCPESADATHILLYFKSTGQALAGEASTGAIPITPGATVVTEHVKKNKRCVKISSPGDTRAYFLVSEDGSVGNASWIEALTTLSTPDNAAELRRMTLGDHPPAAVKHLDGQQENAAGGSHASAKLSSLLFREIWILPAHLLPPPPPPPQPLWHGTPLLRQLRVRKMHVPRPPPEKF